MAVPQGQKLAIFAKIGNFCLIFIGSDFLLEIQFLAIFGQYSFQQYFFWLPRRFRVRPKSTVLQNFPKKRMLKELFFVMTSCQMVRASDET